MRQQAAGKCIVVTLPLQVISTKQANVVNITSYLSGAMV